MPPIITLFVIAIIPKNLIVRSCNNNNFHLISKSNHAVDPSTIELLLEDAEVGERTSDA